MSYQFLANLIISGKITCITGLHIGGTQEGYEIGGMDNPVIKDPIEGYPYIPGSSLKGKLRSLLEWSMPNKINPTGEIHTCDGSNCFLCRIFGSPAELNRKIGPTRIIIQDAYPDKTTIQLMDDLQRDKGLPKVEWKTENAINRIDSSATPRTIERVPKGAMFDLNILYGIYKIPGEDTLKDIEALEYLFQAMRSLEDSTLGGGGSRGSGRIIFGKFDNNSQKVTEGLTLKLRKLDYYQGTRKEDIPIKGTFPKTQQEFQKIKKELEKHL
jgi:CRISPR-associated protein Csm3